MANFTADNYTQNNFNNPYGNKSTVDAILTLGTYAQYDTFDLAKVPAGARVLGGFVVVATAVATSTICVGVKYADGTSTGGTTGTAVVGTGATLSTALAPQTLSCVPFVNDVDTILYATVLSPGFAPGANIPLHAVVDYVAEGTK